ncbi:TonB-dependent receptor [Gelidibacter gilvus]|nr:carboxypeptidase-like regulatory domain-containing protein [Gelidibacter gilvus]
MRNQLKKKRINIRNKYSSIGLKLIILLFSFNAIYSQEPIKIFGVVQDSLSQPLDIVTVVLFDNDERYVSDFRTKNDGQFLFELLPQKSQYVLKFRSLAYSTDDIIVKVDENTSEYGYKVIMSSYITKLDEVVIQGSQPVRIKKDTIVFKAANFLDKTNEVLEDLLKNLPGVEIDTDGTVKVNGKGINKVLIGGDDVFDNNYKIATKNIDAKDVDEIEIIYNFNENSVLRAIVESEAIAINISIKDERSGAIYGKGSIGYGNDNNYIGGLTLFKLDKKLKTFLISKTNTTGIGANDNLNGSMFRRSGSGNFDKYQAFSDNIISTDGVASNPVINESYLNDNRSYFNSLHVLTKPKSNIHVRTIFYLLDDAIKRQNAFKTFYYSPPVFDISQSKVIHNNMREFNAELNIKNANGSKSFIEYNGIFNNANQQSHIDLTIDQNKFNENLSIKDYFISQQLNTTFRINRKSTFSLNMFYLQDKNPQVYATNNPIIENQGVISQSYNNPIRHFGFNSKLISTKSQWNFGFLNKNEKLISEILNDESKLLSEDFDFYNNIKYNNNDFFVYREYDFLFNKNYVLSINAKAGYNFVKYKTDTADQNPVSSP